VPLVTIFITFARPLFALEDVSQLLLNQNELFKKTQRLDANFENAISSVDINQYRIGSGDVFSIKASGLSSFEYTLTVNQTGELYLPDMGVLKVDRLILKDALKAITDYVQQHSRLKGQLYISFENTKKVSISVTGAIANPGSYLLDGSSRVLDAIRAANNNTLPSFSEYNYREVVCGNSDSLVVLDLFQYLLKNDMSSNPYIFPGDKISINLCQQRVFVQGPIRSIIHDNVPIKQDENAKSFLSLFLLDASTDSNNIVIKQASSKEPRFLDWNSLSEVNLQDQDVVILTRKKNYPKITVVKIYGEVASPGIYPIDEKKTTVKDIIEVAGGPTEYAVKDRILLFRKGAAVGAKIKGSAQRDVNSPIDMRFLRPELNTSFLKLNVSNDYTVKTLKSSNANELLDPDDNILIPKAETQVYISGNVREPGAYSYKPGKRISYYAGKAGGYSNKADKTNIYVCTVFDGTLQVKGGDRIDPGDIIVVPESQQNRVLNTIMLPFLSTIASVLMAIVAIYSVAQR